MSDKSGEESLGLFAAMRNIVATLLAGGKTRLELLSNEFEEEKLRTIRLLLLAQGMVFCLGVGVLLAAALLTAVFWDNRLLVLGMSAGGFLLLGAIFYLLFKQSTQRPDRAFAVSIAELQEDLRQLKAAVGHEPPAQ